MSEVMMMTSNINFKKYFAFALSIFMLSSISTLTFIQQVQAQTPKRASVQAVKRAPASHQKSFIDSRYQHNRSYPSRGQSFRALPRDHKSVIHGHSRYYSSHGVWYRHDRGRYFVVAPPLGLFVPFLPLFYTTVWFNGIPYYYANEIYYSQTPGGYVVIEPPQGEVSETPPDTEGEEGEDIAGDKMFIYPRNGQKEEQQEVDRYECHKLAVENTNYDPTKITSQVPAEQIMQKRADYQRMMADCLGSRGYTTK
jgi:hypothetical protein